MTLFSPVIRRKEVRNYATNTHQNLPEGSVLHTIYLAPSLNSQIEDHVTTAMDGHPPSGDGLPPHHPKDGHPPSKMVTHLTKDAHLASNGWAPRVYRLVRGPTDVRIRKNHNFRTEDDIAPTQVY